VFEAISDKYPDIFFAKVNTEEQQELAGMFQIRSIPTLMIFREQIIIFAQPGALPGSALEEIIGKAKDLDMDHVRKEIAAQQSQPA
jgi:thioredoxin 1